MAKKRKTDLSKYENKEKQLKHLDRHLKTHLTFGQRAADVVTKYCGSWTFIILLFTLMGLWIFLNMYAYFYHWDPWPFIILNLTLSCLAAIQAPIILMSQNREVERDRIKAERDFLINRKAEKEIKNIQADLQRIKRLIMRR